MNGQLPNFWRRRSWLSYLLWPLALIFSLISRLRRCYLTARTWRSPVPLVVVGNLTVGGNGKTPLVIGLTRALLADGVQVGLISRGYGRKSTAPLLLADGRIYGAMNGKEGSAADFVGDDQDAARRIGGSDFVGDDRDGGANKVGDDRNGGSDKVGDEPLLIHQQTGAPIAVAADRRAAVQLLLQHRPHLQLLISDDGLQHYGLARDLEIVAVAPDLGWGNGFLLPAGPLRELPSRGADYFIYTGAGGSNNFLTCGRRIALYSLASGAELTWAQLRPPHFALTAIARPERFFRELEAHLPLQGLRALADHSPISFRQCAFARTGTLLVSSKDAVKMAHWPLARRQNIVVVDYALTPPQQVINRIKGLL